MPIIAKRQFSTFTPAPEGPQQAVCVDVVDLGMQEEQWGDEPAQMKHKVKLVWHSAEIDPETDRPYVISKRYNLSLHEKATLLKDLEAWRGRAFTEAELDAFDLEQLIGVNAYLSITHRTTKKGTFANVGSIMKLPKGTDQLPITPGYVRVCHKPETTYNPNGDDSVPF